MLQSTILNRSALWNLLAMTVMLTSLFLIRDRLMPVEARVDLSNRLLVTTRDQFRLCVQTSIQNPEQRAHIVEHLTEAQSRIEQRSDWQRVPVLVAPLEMDCNTELPAGRLVRGVPILSEVAILPSPYRSMIFVLSESEAESKLGSDGAMLIPYEMMQIDDHNAVEVTSALVVRESFLDAPEFNDWYYPLVIGLPPLEERYSGEEGQHDK